MDTAFRFADGEIRPVGSLDQLADVLSGTLVRPGDSAWDAARAAWQLLVDQEPAAVAEAANTHDVAVVVRAAAALGLRVAPQSTGHNAAPLGELSRSILLRTDALGAMEIDGVAGTARIGAGVRGDDLAVAAQEAGFAAVLGFGASVGVIGLLLGGGLGWFARSHGPASASVLELELVTGDGVTRIAAPGSELFELVMAGADVAVVTAATLRLHRAGELVGGSLLWPARQAREVLHAWTEWSAELPETVTSVARVLRLPESPQLPPMLSGGSFAVIEAVVQGGVAEADAFLRPLRALAPQMDTFAPAAPVSLLALHGDPPMPSAALGCSAVLRSLPVMTVEALADAVLHGPASALTSVELRQLGGALDRSETAVTGARALLHAVAVAGDPSAALAPNPAAIAAAHAAFESLASAVGPVRSPRDLRGFTEEPADPARLFGPELARLQAAKRQWDPENLIQANHPVLPR